MRVILYQNGDVAKANGKLLAVPDNFTFAELLAKATERLGSPKPFTRVFVENGAEVQELADLVNGDELFFSVGDAFARPDFKAAFDDSLGTLAVPPSSAAAAGDDDSALSMEKQRKQFLASIATSVSGVAASLYDSSSTFVKGHAPTFVKVTLEKVEDKVGAFASPLITRVVQVGQWADEKLDGYYQSLVQKRQEFLDSELAKQVNASLVLPFRTQVIEPGQQFYQAAVENFKALQKQNGQVTVDAFVSTLRTKLGQTWNDKLVEPAKAFHAAAMERVAANQTLTNLKDRLGAAWNEKVVANFRDNVAQPAEEFYNAALESYMSLDTTGDGTVTLAEFTAGMRVKLGQLWSAKLTEPASFLFEKFRGVTQGSAAAAAAAAASSTATAAAAPAVVKKSS